MSSLLAERGPIHVHVGATIIVEGAPPGYDELIAHVEERLGLVPRFRQRVTETPLGLDNPVWTDDASFDARRHVRHVAVPRPGRLDQLRDLVGRVMSEPLDMSRPLWQLYLIEGLRGGRHAYVSKTHHALVDGVAAVDVGTILLDATPEGAKLKLPDEPWEPDEPSPAMLFTQAASERVARPLRSARRAARSALAMPGETASRVLRTAEAFTGLAAGGPTCPRSTLNVRIGRDRLVAWARTDLVRLKRARGEGGATVNDVILAVATGALRRFLQGRGDEVPDYLVALVPVSIRTPDEKGELGNRISTILVKLPLGESDPAKRLERIREETARLKESETARAASLLIQATGWAPPTINRLLSQAMARPLVFNVVVSNVPGPQQPFYLLGRRLREIYPFVPLSPQNHALSIGVVSYDGRVFFGLVGDRDAVSDLDELAAAIGESLREQTSRRASPNKRAGSPRKQRPKRRRTAEARRG
jgi:WS/DGAT/MGAT family acyltransferase